MNLTLVSLDKIIEPVSFVRFVTYNKRIGADLPNRFSSAFRIASGCFYRFAYHKDSSSLFRCKFGGKRNNCVTAGNKCMISPSISLIGGKLMVFEIYGL